MGEALNFKKGIPIHFRLSCISHGGCGVVASYNALHTLGNPKSFDDVLAYYNNRMAFTLGWGFTGLSPSAVAGYFSDLGYSVMLTDDPDSIDLLSKTADACIMYYMLPRSYLGLDAYGAHFCRVSQGWQWIHRCKYERVIWTLFIHKSI